MSKEIALADILKELSNVSGFRISIYDTEQNELEAYPKKGSVFCQFIQKNPKALSLCHKNDKNAFETANKLAMFIFTSVVLAYMKRLLLCITMASFRVI